ncbi:MAG TPA: hypothetical protein VKS22_12860 [Candidatus Binataceae bacterium]|nr:hypothetical protein [Candidatus Binataceae bacterium]
MFSDAILFANHVGKLTRHDPALWEIPTALQDSSRPSAPGETLSYLGYEFDVPRDALDPQRTRVAGSLVMICLRTGMTIFISKHPTGEFVHTPRSQSHRVRFKLLLAWGHEASRSDYALVRAALGTTPADICLFNPIAANHGTALLLMKSTLLGVMPRAESGIFFLQTKYFRGFQYGEPRSRPSEIDDYLFGREDNLHFIFRNRRREISQAEINRVIQSVRMVPAAHASN